MPVSRRRQVIAAVLANALEWYDFVVFGFLTVIIAKLFFPAETEYSALLYTTATFGVGFFMRPVGGVLLGIYADRRGRKSAMQLIIALMSISLLIIAVAPTHAAIGIGAPLLIVFARLLQGFATGGQYAIATSFLVEVAPRHQRGLYGSFQMVGQALAALGGAVVGMFITVGLEPEQLNSWGWRLPFAVGLLIAPVGVYIARHMEETDEFVALQKAPERVPLLRLLHQNLRGVLVTFGLILSATICYYVILIYMPTFAQKQLAIAAGDAFTVQAIALVCLTVVIPISGAISDRVGQRPVLIVGAVLLLGVLYPLFERVHAAPTFSNLLLLQVTVCSVLGIYFGGLATAVAEQFPPGVRSTGLSLAYNLAVMIFGGFAQFVVTWLIGTTGNPLAAAYYVIFGAVCGVFAAWFARPVARAAA